MDAINVVGIVVGCVILAWAVVMTGVAMGCGRRLDEARDDARTWQQEAKHQTANRLTVERAMGELAGTVKVLDGQVEAMRGMSSEINARLLEYALPHRDDGATRGRDEVIDSRSEAEYEPPERPINDWTDPFFRMGDERPLSAGLAPGQPIPGIGEQAGEVADDGAPLGYPGDGYEQLADHPMAAGMLPEDGELQDDRQHDRDLGEELFDAWEAGR